jgi:hypothetical protein
MLLNSRCDMLARRLSAEASYREGIAADEPAQALLALSQAVWLSPDLPIYRLGLAEATARLDAASTSRAAASRALRRAGILASLALVLAHGGRAAVVAEPYASAWVLGSKPLRAALTRAGTASPRRMDEALRARPLHRGAAATILRALLTGVRIQEPDLLARLEELRHNFIRATLSGEGRVLSVAAAEFLEMLANQVWIQDCMLTRLPAPDLMKRLASASVSPAIGRLSRRLFPDAGAS